jgi:hypothetical protein
MERRYSSTLNVTVRLVPAKSILLVNEDRNLHALMGSLTRPPVTCGSGAEKNPVPARQKTVWAPEFI